MSAAALLVYSSCVLIPRRHVHDECEERLGRTRCFRSCDPTAKFWLSGLKRHLSREYARTPITPAVSSPSLLNGRGTLANDTATSCLQYPQGAT